MRNINTLIVLFLMLGGAGCAVSSGDRIQKLATRNSFVSGIEEGSGFSLMVFANQKPLAKNGVLNIYLEGDGVPWQFRYFVSPDPTPRHPLMLDLMSMDKNAAFYVGRPCYNGFSDEEQCDPKYWTSSRHAKVIVDSMADTIARLVERTGATGVNLFGHSGGGAMAMLIAARLNATNFLVTLAGNLDLAAWTSLHGYSPLYGSLDPATQPLLPKTIKQIHLMAEKDRNIPPEIALKQVRRQRNSDYYIFEGFTHTGHWREVWPGVLSLVSGEAPANVKKFRGEGSMAPVFDH